MLKIVGVHHLAITYPLVGPKFIYSLIVKVVANTIIQLGLEIFDLSLFFPLVQKLIKLLFMIIQIAFALPRLHTSISVDLSGSSHVFHVFLLVRVFGNVNGWGCPLCQPLWTWRLISPIFFEGMTPRTLLFDQYLLRVIFGQFIILIRINLALPCFIFKGLHEAATELINFAQSIYVEIFGVLHLS